MRFAIVVFLLFLSTPLVFSQTVTIAQYICDRIVEMGTNTVFSVTGDFSYQFLAEVDETPGLTRVGNNGEMEAAYAAWAYGHVSPVRAPGVVSVTYGPGSYPIITALGGAMRENVPVIAIAGSGSTMNWQYYDSFGADNHHMLEGPPTTQRDVFRPVTIAQEIISNVATATQQIDSLFITALTQNRPVYLEVWVDMWLQRVPPPAVPLTRAGLPTPVATIQSNVNAAAQYTLSQLQASKFPIIFASYEIKIYNLQALFQQLLTLANIPYYTNYAGKGLLAEPNPYFAGILSVNNTLEYMADFLLEVGTTYDDNSKTTAAFAPNVRNYVRARRGKVDTANRNLYNNVPLEPYLRALITAITASGYHNNNYSATQAKVYGTPIPDAPNSNLTYATFVNHLLYSGIVNQGSTLIVDTTIIAYYMQKVIPIRQDGYVGDTFWLAIGWSGGASLGVKQALPDQRMLVVVGDGGFQNCPNGLGTSVELGHNTIVFILHNNVYAIEQNIEDPTPYTNRSVPFFPDNIIQDWNYAQYGASVGANSYRTFTHADLTFAINGAIAHNGTSVIEIMLDKWDRPPQGNNLVLNGGSGGSTTGSNPTTAASTTGAASSTAASTAAATAATIAATITTAAAATTLSSTPPPGTTTAKVTTSTTKAASSTTSTTKSATSSTTKPATTSTTKTASSTTKSATSKHTSYHGYDADEE